MDERSYERALEALETLISGRKRSDGKTWEEQYLAMHAYLETLNLHKDLRQLKVIHVAGTKGKGSTCAMVESVLRSAGYRTGLFTSPHLFDVRERIRIEGQPVSKDIFLEHFWACFTTFQKQSQEKPGMPAYFRFLTLLGFKVFLAQKVDVVILEVGLGGRLDATNIVPQPIVCGITPLGYDHMDVLGHTLREIATEKAGIFKPGSPALTVPQPCEAQLALERKAAEVGITLTIVPPLETYTTASGTRPSIGLAGRHQEVNAALAIALAAAWEAGTAWPGTQAEENATALAIGLLPESYTQGLQAATWQGRGQVVNDCGGEQSKLTFFLDGAHTPESMVACGDWFADCTSAETMIRKGNPMASGQAETQDNLNRHDAEDTQRFLIFNCMQERDPQRLMESLKRTLDKRGTCIDHALFVPPDSLYSKASTSTAGDNQSRDLSWQLTLQRSWESLLSRPYKKASVSFQTMPVTLGELVQDSRKGAVMLNVKGTVAWLRQCARRNPTTRMQVLVTGSLYLVGDLLRQLTTPDL